MTFSIIKNRMLALAGFLWMVFSGLYFIIMSWRYLKSGTLDLEDFFLNLNIIFLPAWILLLCSLDLSKKNRWKYKRK